MQLTTGNAFFGIVIAIITGLIAARKFPAQKQSKLWVKVFGAELGAITAGRVWTFLSVVIIVALLWGFLMWIPSNF
jgi:hypothetical protein